MQYMTSRPAAENSGQYEHMKDKLSELQDRVAKVQRIQRSANEMRESEKGPNSQIK